ncbi:LPXTG cell wall anchor domain-containing protein [Micromonospora vulcania]|uniref:LPXTG cell wall anchor domain-containing protein n=1 Tax=Micromonospora vulcania TaxID=1441873 RepID=A0ABW1H9S1_9ACTN
MGRTAVGWLVGGALAATASLAVAVPTVLAPGDPVAVAAVLAAPSGDTGVTFEVIPGTPTPTPTGEPTQPPPSPTGEPTQPPPSPTYDPTQPPPSPTYDPTQPPPTELPVTGSGSSTAGPVALLGMALILIGWMVVRRQRRE